MKIRDLKYGEKVSEPGLYRMPLLAYHDQCCIGPSISSTGLRTIDLETPAHYFATSRLNPLFDAEEAERESDDKKHFRIGRAAHLLLLEPELFSAQVVTRPDSFDSWRTKEAKRWRADQLLAGKTVLEPSDLKAVRGCASSMRNDPLYREGILDGEVEISIIWQDRATGVWLKARPDAIPKNAKMLSDLKILSDASPIAVERAVKQLGYDMQMALGGVGMHEVLDMEIEDYALVACEPKNPHAVHVATLDPELVHWARRRLRRAVNTFAHCIESGEWPGYDEFHGRPVRLTNWERERFEADDLAGRMPKSF